MMYDTIVNQPVIEAERFTLRPLRRSDAGHVGMYAGDERVARGTRSIPYPLPPGATEAFISRAMAQDRNEDIWVIDGAGAQGREVLGIIGLTRVGQDQSELCYWVAPAFWNAGIASAAVRALVGANPLANRSIFAEAFQDNPASARVLTNAGFEYIGDAESHSVARNANVPTWTYIKKLG